MGGEVNDNSCLKSEICVEGEGWIGEELTNIGVREERCEEGEHCEGDAITG